MELEDRISPAEFASFVNTLNTHLIAAYSVKGAVVDNVIAIATWWTSLLWRTSTFEKVRCSSYGLPAWHGRRIHQCGLGSMRT